MTPLRIAFAALALLALTHPGLAYEPEKSPRIELLDSEIRANLQGEEPAVWEKLQRRATEARQQIARGKDLTAARKFDFKGSIGSESPEARKARGDAQIKAGEEALAEIAKERAQLAATVESRIQGTAVRMPCPLASLRDSFSRGATEITEAAKAAGYTEVIPAGVLLTGRGGSVHDIGMSALLVETLRANAEAIKAAEADRLAALAKEAADAKAAAEKAEADAKAKADAAKTGGTTPAPVPPPAPVTPAPAVTTPPVVKQAEKPAPTGPAKPAWILGEIRPCESAKGAIVSFRLVDAETGLVHHATLALVPADANELTRRTYGSDAPPAFRATFEDTQNFFSKLGHAERWAFEVEGDDATACIARAVLATAGTPALSDISTLKRLHNTRPSKPVDVKAYWTTAIDTDTKAWRVSTRAAAKNAKPLPVGRIDFSPAPVEKK